MISVGFGGTARQTLKLDVAAEGALAALRAAWDLPAATAVKRALVMTAEREVPVQLETAVRDAEDRRSRLTD